MEGGLLAVALGAGLLAAVNPCGFALLPAYVSLLIARGAAPSRPAAVRRALALTAAMTLGFTGVFGLFGLVVAPIASGIQQHLPWFTVVLGVTLGVLGAAMATGREVRVPLPRRRGRTGAARPMTGSFWSMTGFGASYAVASLSCTIAPFLAVVVGGFRSGSLGQGVLLFVAYAAGMGVVVGTLAVATALASPTTVRRLRSAGGWAPRVAGGLLALAGAYVAWYGAWELRVLGGADPSDPVIGAAAAVQRHVVGLVAAIGPGGWALSGSALLLTTVLLARRVRTGPSRSVPADPGPEDRLTEPGRTPDRAARPPG